MLSEETIKMMAAALNQMADLCDHIDENVPGCLACDAHAAMEAYDFDAEDRRFVAEFSEIEQVQRLAYLTHQDLARTLGSIQIAHEKMERMGREGHLPGSQRRKAVQTLEAGPEQAERSRRAQESLQACIRQARERGQA